MDRFLTEIYFEREEGIGEEVEKETHGKKREKVVWESLAGPASKES